MVDYCASKFANVGFDESLRTELYVQGLQDHIQTTCICPYYITTGMFQGVSSKVNSKVFRSLCYRARIQIQPLGHKFNHYCGSRWLGKPSFNCHTTPMIEFMATRSYLCPCTVFSQKYA